MKKDLKDLADEREDAKKDDEGKSNLEKSWITEMVSVVSMKCRLEKI